MVLMNMGKDNTVVFPTLVQVENVYWGFLHSQQVVDGQPTKGRFFMKEFAGGGDVLCLVRDHNL